MTRRTLRHSTTCEDIGPAVVSRSGRRFSAFRPVSLLDWSERTFHPRTQARHNSRTTPSQDTTTTTRHLGARGNAKRRSNARKVSSLHGPRTPPRATARKKKVGNGGILPTAIAAVPSTEKSKKSTVQRRAATRGPHLPRIPQVLRHRSRALPTTLEVAEFVATGRYAGTPHSVELPVLESPLVIPDAVMLSHSLPWP